MDSVTCNGVSAGYGKKNILQNISFRLEAGRNLSIFGSNGSGKTTLLRVLSGTLPGIGEIQIFGRDVQNMTRRELASFVAVMPQFTGSYFSYTVGEIVEMGCYARENDRSSDAMLAVQEAIAATDLTEFVNRPLEQLSGGQQQRVFLARTFAQRTPIILLDEPTSHLDLKFQEETLSYLKQWSLKATTMADGTIYPNCVISVFHDLYQALTLADDVLFLRNGEMLAFGDKKEICRGEIFQQTFGMDMQNYLNRQRQMEQYFV